VDSDENIRFGSQECFLSGKDLTVRLLQTIRGSSIDRHVHTQPYAAIVLSGGIEEAGDTGRFEVNAGNLIFHDCFVAHLNRFPHGGAVVLNLIMPAGRCDPLISRRYPIRTWLRGRQ
jgi:quercetin dioxygenase-like cupin family protein